MAAKWIRSSFSLLGDSSATKGETFMTTITDIYNRFAWVKGIID